MSNPLSRELWAIYCGIKYEVVSIDEKKRTATISIQGPEKKVPLKDLTFAAPPPKKRESLPAP